MTITCVNGQACSGFYETVQCYRQMLCIAVKLSSNFLHLVTLLQTAFVTRRSYTTVLRYMSVSTLIGMKSAKIYK